MPAHPHDPAELRRRYEGGDSAYALARELGVFPSTVYRRLRKAGARVRAMHEAANLREAMGRGKCRAKVREKGRCDAP